jgi:hypothetical protein
MKQGDAFPSVWLKAADLKGKTVTVTIEDCRSEVVDRKTGKTQPVLTFEGKDKQLGLNVTNFKRVAELTGEDDSENWAGHQIALFPCMVDFQGKSIEAIRIKAASSKKVASKPAKDEDESPPPTDDDAPPSEDSEGSFE